MAKSKKTASKKGVASKRSAASLPQGADSMLVLAMTWVFTLLSIVFTLVAYWRYA